MPDGDVPTVTVVISTYNRPQLLEGLVGALEKQDLDAPYEVVIVDNGSAAETAAELHRLQAQTDMSMRVLRIEVNNGPGAARQLGWQQARAPMVAFTDDDCVPTTGWLRELVARLADADVVQGRTLPDPDGDWGPWSRSIRGEAEDFYMTCNVGYRRSVLEDIGGFDLTFRWCEDTEMALRAIERGARTAFAPQAVVHHAVSRSDFGSVWREKPRWEAVAQILARHPQLRDRMPRRWAWRPSHPPAIAAAAGLGLMALGLSRGRSAAGLAGVLAGVGLLAPYARYRTRVDPLPAAGPRRRWLLLAPVLAADLREVGVCARASVRYRTLVL
jgi:hypothetical protein